MASGGARQYEWRVGDVDRELADELWSQLATLVDRRRQDRSLLKHLELLAEQSPGDAELRRNADKWRRAVDAQDREIMRLDGSLLEAVGAARRRGVAQTSARSLIESFRVVFDEMADKGLEDLGETDFTAQVRLSAALATHLPIRPGHWSNPPLHQRRSAAGRTPAAVVALRTIAAVMRGDADALDRVAASEDYPGHDTIEKRARLEALPGILDREGAQRAAEAATNAFAGIRVPHMRLVRAPEE